MEPFLTSKEPALNLVHAALAEDMKVLKEKYKGAIAYGATMNALLREACTLLEGLDVTVDVSEKLAWWWEREKGKVASQILSSDGTPVRRRVEQVPTVDQPEPANDKSSV